MASGATDMSEKHIDSKLKDHVLGTIYGNCVGDAVGLLTEFMTKSEAQEYYGKQPLEYCIKVNDFHRSRWKDGDWTDDSDQMLLIMQSVVEFNGKVDYQDFAQRLMFWSKNGIPECEDMGGMGIGATTRAVLHHPSYSTDSHVASEEVWRRTGELHHRYPAPNGGVMRTSILGIHRFKNIDEVIKNTIDVCKVTHHDPRCVASCVAVVTAIAQMLQTVLNHKPIKVKDVCEKSYEYACCYLDSDKEKEELRQCMFPKKLKDLMLDESGKIGYTYKTLGAGFYALHKSDKNDFRKIMEKLVREAGDADTNGAVAGALLGCRLGYKAIPETWRDRLYYREYLETNVKRFLNCSHWDDDSKVSDGN